MDFSGKRILILGLAREGVSLARFFHHQGATVLISDRAPADHLAQRRQEIGDIATQYLGDDYPDLVHQVDLLYVSPGVPESNPVYRAARAAGLPIESMTTLFFALCPAPIIGITGSSGKTTTTGLIGHICRAAGRDTAVGGNIGSPMLDLLPSTRSDTTVVLELSSFQLSLLERGPHIALVTNISPNHLDRHTGMDDYVAAKRRILAHQTVRDYVVLNRSDPTVSSFAAGARAQVRWFTGSSENDYGAVVADDHVGLSTDAGFTPVLPLCDIPLLGQHNVDNVLAAIAVATVLEIDPVVMARAIRTFRAPPHRLQLVAERGGIQYVDDSIATSPARSLVAVRSFDRPILLIAGGRDKRLPWEEFAQAAAERVRALFLIGEAAEQIDDAVRSAITPLTTLQPPAIHRCMSLEAAVAAASWQAQHGDVVLLSPGCTSYDMFSDFAERGAAFAHAVEMLDAA